MFASGAAVRDLEVAGVRLVKKVFGDGLGFGAPLGARLLGALLVGRSRRPATGPWIGRWAAGPLGRWAAGPLGRWAAGPPSRRAAEPPGRRAAGRWDAGPLGRWAAWPLLGPLLGSPLGRRWAAGLGLGWFWGSLRR